MATCMATRSLARLALLVVTVLLVMLLTSRTAAAQPLAPGPVYLPVVAGGVTGPGPGELVPVEEMFPVGMAVASPFNLIAAGSPQSTRTTPQSAGPVPAYTVVSERIHSVLLSTGTVPITDAVRGMMAGGAGGRANCYGPTLDFSNYPGDMTGATGQLPGGDLGIWLEYEPQQWGDPHMPDVYTETVGIGTADAYTVTYGAPGHACSVAQLNALMRSIETQSESALTLAAALVVQAVSSGVAIPADGTDVDLTAAMNADYDFGFLSAVISRTTDAVYYSITLTATEAQLNSSAAALTVRLDPEEHVYTATINLRHEPDSSAPLTVYAGLLTYQVIDNDYRGGLQCSAPTPAPMSAALSGSLKYGRSGADDLKLQSRSAAFCMDSAGLAFSGAGLAQDNWSDNYAVFTANFDPTAAFAATAIMSDALTTDLAGTYAFAWQAGHGDAYSRVFNAGVNDHSPIDGETYFGFGRRIQSAAGHSYIVTDTLGAVATLTPGDLVVAVEGMFCKWAGPDTGADADRFRPFAQRQFVRLDESTGFFIVPAGGSDIRYAPTNDCLYEDADSEYDNSVDFWYDRNLNFVRDEVYADPLANDNPFGDRGVAALAGVSDDTEGLFDLMDVVQGGLDYGTIVNMIIYGRGYDLPVAP